MKGENGVVVIACNLTPDVSPVPPNSTSQQHQFPTPSPFAFSVASTTRWSSRPSILVIALVLRSLVLIFAFASALSLATQSRKTKGQQSSSFTEFPELIYCFVVAILVIVYSVFQLYKGINEIAPTARNIIPNEISDYISFIFDQLAVYLLISSATMVIPIASRMEHYAILRRVAMVSIGMSSAAFVAMAICALLSGYKLCKRISW